VYVGADDGKVYAFDAAGTTGCSGSPKTCEPLWTAATGGGVDSSPAVVDGIVYVGSYAVSDANRVYAFSAAGTTGCTGSPKTCKPLWTAPLGEGVSSSPAVADGVVYIGSDAADHAGKLYAFSAAGTTGCSGTPKTCAPLWTATTGGDVESSPAVANGVVYVGSHDGELYAYDAAGTTGCSGSPKTWEPLWTATAGNYVQSSPAVANGVVYVGSEDHSVYAFDAAGMTGCSGSPKTCAPLWTAATGSFVYSSPAVANGIVYVGSYDGKLYAFGLPIGDINHDGKVGCLDLAILKAEYHRSGPNLRADLNHDGTVDIYDFSVMAAHWTGDGDTSCQNGSAKPARPAERR
jgi:outer membrane protein assembly factor BamB